MRLALFGVLVVLACSSFAELDERIKVVIEEPAVGESYSGVTNLRGWVVSPAGIGRYALEVYIDGEFAFYMPVGGDRADVAEAYSNYPGSDQSGFSMAFNYKSLSPGTHEIKVRAFDNVDNYNDAWVSFDAEKFKSDFIADESEIDLSTTENVYLVDNQTYSVIGATVEGQKWDFLLSWDTASQSFKTENIRTSSAQGDVDSCDPEFDFGCSADGTYGDGDSSSGGSSNSGSGGGYVPADDGSGSSSDSDEDDPCSGTGYNPNCSDSSASSSGPGENSSGSSDSTGTTADSSGGGYVPANDGSGSSSDSDEDDPCSGTGYNPNCSDSSASSSGSDDGSGSSSDSDEDDPCSGTGYNPNCSDSSASSSGSGENSSGSSDSTGTTADSSGGGYQLPTNVACVTSINYDRSNDSVIEMYNGLVLANDPERNFFRVRQWADLVFRSQAGDWYMIVNFEELMFIEVMREPDTCEPYATGWVGLVSSDSQGNLILETEGLEYGPYAFTVDSSCPIGVGSEVVAYWVEDPYSRLWVVDLATADVCEASNWSSL